MSKNVILALVLCVAAGPALATEYVDADCQQVVGTLNIHWEAVGGPFAPCTGIEFTDGTLADAADGTVTMSGTSVSNGSCIGTDSYTFTVSPDGLTLTGGTPTIPMTLVRLPTEDCFVGHWIDAFGNDYLAHIAADPFPTTQVPASGLPNLIALGALLGLTLAVVAVLRKNTGLAEHGGEAS